MKCLFVIDVQQGFLTPESEHILPRLDQLLADFDGPIIATKFVNHPDSPFVSIMGWEDLMSSPETDLSPAVEARADYVVEKDLYTACTPEVMALLEKLSVREAYVVGIDTDCCVLKTAADLFEAGIRPILLPHYCASTGGQASHEAGVLVLERTLGADQIQHGIYRP